jgi:hypothetical protein
MNDPEAEPRSIKKSSRTKKQFEVEPRGINQSKNKYKVCFTPLAMTLNPNVIAREERPKQSKKPIPN